MLNLEQRLALLEKELSAQSQGELVRELEQYEGESPLAIDFLESLSKARDFEVSQSSCSRKEGECQNTQAPIKD